MRRLAVCLFLCLLASCCKSNTTVTVAPSDINFGLITKLKDNAAILTEMEGDEPHVICSGVYVAHDMILSAGHCAEDGAVGLSYLDEVDDSGLAKRWRPLELVALDHDRDLSLPVSYTHLRAHET